MMKFVVIMDYKSFSFDDGMDALSFATTAKNKFNGETYSRNKNLDVVIKVMTEEEFTKKYQSIDEEEEE